MSRTLFEILDHETGSSWDGTHGRNIHVRFQADNIIVRSQNAMYSEFTEQPFTQDDIRAQHAQAVNAKYYKEFMDVLKCSKEPESLSFKKLLSIPVTPEEEKEAHFSRLKKLLVAGQHEELERRLAENIIDINYRPQEFSALTLLQYAVNFDDQKACGILLDHGADPDIVSDSGASLHRAAFRNNVEIVQLLLDRGANIDKPKKYGGTPLQVAVEWSQKEAMEVLLDRGADPYKASVDLFAFARERAEKEDARADAWEVVRLLDDWKEKQAHAAHLNNLARLDRILARKKG